MQIHSIIKDHWNRWAGVVRQFYTSKIISTTNFLTLFLIPPFLFFLNSLFNFQPIWAGLQLKNIFSVNLVIIFQSSESSSSLRLDHLAEIGSVFSPMPSHQCSFKALLFSQQTSSFLPWTHTAPTLSVPTCCLLDWFGYLNILVSVRLSRLPLLSGLLIFFQLSLTFVAIFSHLLFFFSFELLSSHCAIPSLFHVLLSKLLFN